jgi:hypothetical protein
MATAWVQWIFATILRCYMPIHDHRSTKAAKAMRDDQEIRLASGQYIAILLQSASTECKASLGAAVVQAPFHRYMASFYRIAQSFEAQVAAIHSEWMVL